MLMPKKVKYRKQMRGRRKGKAWRDRKSTRLNSSHSQISYAVFCLKKKKTVDGGLRCASGPQGRPDVPAAETAEGEATEDVTWRRKWVVWRKPPDGSCGRAQSLSRRGARRSSPIGGTRSMR